MEYEKQPPSSAPKLKPRLVIHGGAGNIQPTYPPETYQAYRTALLTIVRLPFPSQSNPPNPSSPDQLAHRSPPQMPS